MLINEIDQVIQPVTNWSMWSAVAAIASITFLLIGLIIRLTRNHTRLEEGHRNLEKTTADRFKVVHHRIDSKADESVLKSIDEKLNLILDKIL